MDVNGVRFHLLDDERDFQPRPAELEWDERHRALLLAHADAPRIAGATRAEALDALGEVRPIVRDAYGQTATLAKDRKSIEFTAGNPDEIIAGTLASEGPGGSAPLAPPRGEFVDLSLGGGGRLAALWRDDTAPPRSGVLLFDLQRRWVEAVEFDGSASRVAVDELDRVWVAVEGKLLLFGGGPLPHPYEPQSTRFEPRPTNPHPFRALEPFAGIELAVAGDVFGLCAARGRVSALMTRADGSQAIVAVDTRQPASARAVAHELDIANTVFTDLAPVDEQRLALLTVPPTRVGVHDCAVVRLVAASDGVPARAELVRERYPLPLRAASPRFVIGADGALRYATESGPLGIHRLAHARRFERGRLERARPLDSGIPGCVWHRVYLEGCIPPGCDVIVRARAADAVARLSASEWERQPDWVRCAGPSELAFHVGSTDPADPHGGLRELLLQAEGGPQRCLQGRHLQLSVELVGDGRHTPSVQSLRVYAPRFAYQEEYLPEHFRRPAHAVEPRRVGEVRTESAAGSDLRERYFAAFEGMLTPIEGRVAAAETLLDPAATPERYLDWLANFCSLRLDPSWSVERRRRAVTVGVALQRQRGTRRGVLGALDVATDGGVGRGEVVVVENHRLRRTMGTLLGVRMEDEDHPLTLGTLKTGNSIVGDTLVLSTETAREFLALFDPEVARADEALAVQRFFDEHAHRVSILLHGRGIAQRRTVEGVLRRELPAHVGWNVYAVEHPFVVGLSPLEGIDTYVEATPAPERARLNSARLGRKGVLQSPAAFCQEAVLD